MTRMGIFSFFALLIVVTSFACHFYNFLYQADWEQSLREYVVCRAYNYAPWTSSTDESVVKSGNKNEIEIGV